jgi:hypothetical protein
MSRECYFCHIVIEPYEPGSSLDEEYGVCHTKCLYDHLGKEVPEILR